MRRGESGLTLRNLLAQASCYNKQMRLSRLRNQFEGLLLRSRRFFIKNETGFAYLFFAHTLYYVVSFYWSTQNSRPVGIALLNLYAPWLVLYTILMYYALPLIFIIAAFLTFHYPKDKNARILFVLVILMISLMITTTTS